MQIGGDYQFVPNWVVGIEGQFSWLGNNNNGVIIPGGFVFSSNQRGLGSVTGRLGYTWGPTLLYVKGGYAYSDYSDFLTLNGAPIAFCSGRAKFLVEYLIDRMDKPLIGDAPARAVVLHGWLIYGYEWADMPKEGLSGKEAEHRRSFDAIIKRGWRGTTASSGASWCCSQDSWPSGSKTDGDLPQGSAQHSGQSLTVDRYVPYHSDYEFPFGF